MKKMFLDIADAAPVGVLAICAEAIIRFANPALYNIFGYADDALIGEPVEILLPDAKQALHPGLRKGFFASPSSRGLGEEHNLIGRHAEGWPIAVEIGLGSIGQGADALSVAFINDISHKKLAEERLTAIVSALPAGLVMVGPDGRILLTNPALDEMFGYPSGALVGQQEELLMPLRNRFEHAVLRETYMRAPDRRMMGAGRDLLGLHSSGREFPVEVSLSPIFHAQQRSTLAVITDISAARKLEHAVVQANINLEEFTYIASHDLRSPLRGIADLLEWIEEDLDPAAMNDAVVKNFARVKQRIARTERMIEDLLIYARSNTQDPRTETTSPRQLIAELTEFALPPSGFTIEIDAPDITFVTCKTPLLTALRNLLDNALKHHGGAQGRIKITVHEDSRFLVFSVDDDGAGVPDNAREKIFKLFQRASDATEGHGVGLSVTRRMVTSHGGKLILEDLSPMGGACFTIHWPRYEMKEMA